ncbi:MAG: hypothetical protein HOB73_05435 [Planctomycetaceae bacterium]|nr:hypothetical protein [Planctomycetaceae bacterium]
MEDIKKHLFWGVSGVVVLTISIMWFLAIGSLNEERTNNESRISSTFSNLKEITDLGNHPNAKFDEGMNIILSTVKTDIHKTWQDKYNVQKQSLNWPVGPDQLDRITANYFEPLAPIELRVEMDGVINPLNNSVKTEISQIARSKYKDFTSIYLPTLADIVDARWGSDPDAGNGFGDASAGEGGAADTATVNDHLVLWKESNQKSLASRFSWAGSVPTTLEILYAQEDLWVLNQWLKIIADMNKTADAAYNAKVTNIIGIDLAKNGAFSGPTGVDLAKEAILSGGKVAGGDAGGMGDDMGGMDGMMGGMGGMMGGMEGTGGPDGGGEGGGGESGGDAGGGTGAAEPSSDPGDLRYVDDTYQPLAISELRTALNITTKSRNVRPELAIAKRYPTRIRLTIDLRFLHQFLAACGNAELSIEVLQVRINAPSGMNKGGGDSGAMGGAMGGAMDGGMSEGDMGGAMGGMGGAMGGMGGAMGGMGGATGGMGGGIASQIPTMQYHVEVEIYGIVHIYNPVNLAALGIDPQENNTNNNTPADPGGEAE